jgi:hypothetical protein
VCGKLRLGDGGVGNAPCVPTHRAHPDAAAIFRPSLLPPPQLAESTTTEEEEATTDGERVVAYEPHAKSSAASPGQRSSPTGRVWFLSPRGRDTTRGPSAKQPCGRGVTRGSRNLSPSARPPSEAGLRGARPRSVRRGRTWSKTGALGPPDLPHPLIAAPERGI